MRKKNIRIAVLSDQHIWSDAAPDSWELAKAAFKAAAKAKVDHIVLAGDTFDCASAMHEDRVKVERYLRRLDLWHRDRLTIVVGNHDIFHTPHHGSLPRRTLEFANIAGMNGQENYDTFIAWAGQLAGERDRLAGDDDLYPIEKRIGHVRLWAVDTTGTDTSEGGNGYWPKEDDRILRRVVEESSERRILAIHNPPFQSKEWSIDDISEYLKGEFPFGFPKKELRRLERFTDFAEVDAIVCGHIHDMGDDDDGDDDPWTWSIGNSWACDVRVVGRTGGVHNATPMFGILNVPVEGDLEWEEMEI